MLCREVPFQALPRPANNSYKIIHFSKMRALKGRHGWLQDRTHNDPKIKPYKL